MDGSANNPSANRESARDATKNYPQSGRTLQVVRVQRRPPGTRCGRSPDDRSDDRATVQRAADLFGLPAGAARLRPFAAAAIRVRPVVGHSGVLRVRDAARELPGLRCDRGRSSLGRRQMHAHEELSLVPGGVGQTALLERDRRGLRHDLGEGVSSGKTRGSVGPGASRDPGAEGDWRGRDPVATGPQVPDAGVPNRSGDEASLVGGQGPHGAEPHGVL